MISGRAIPDIDRAGCARVSLGLCLRSENCAASGARGEDLRSAAGGAVDARVQGAPACAAYRLGGNRLDLVLQLLAEANIEVDQVAARRERVRELRHRGRVERSLLQVERGERGGPSAVTSASALTP